MERKDKRAMLRLTEQDWRDLKFWAKEEGRSDQDQARWYITEGVKHSKAKHGNDAGAQIRQQMSASPKVPQNVSQPMATNGNRRQQGRPAA